MRHLLDGASRGITYANFGGGLILLLVGLIRPNPWMLVVGALTFTGAVANLRWPR